MKRIIATIIAIMMALALVACSGTKQDQAENDDMISDVSTETVETEEEAYADADLGEFRKDSHISETLLYDKDDVKITATDMIYGSYSVEVYLKFENNSKKKLTFIAGSLGCPLNAINQYMISGGYVNCEVEAGGSAEETARFNYDELMIYGITEIAEIQMGFDISDDNFNSIATGPVSVKTDLAGNVDYEDTTYRENIRSGALKAAYGYDLQYFSEDNIYSSRDINVLSAAYMINKDGERTLLLEVENKTDQKVYFRTRDIKANDVMIYDACWNSSCITPGKKAIVDMNLDRIKDEDEWKETGITEVENIGFTIEVINEDYKNVADSKDVVIGVK